MTRPAAVKSPVWPDDYLIPGIKPYHVEDAGIIYCGDCLDILPHLPKVDLVLTDPPYGHGDKWAGGTWASNPIYAEAFKWDANPVNYELLRQIIERENAIIWGGNYYPLPPSRCWLAWEKKEKMDTLADFELAWTSFDRPSKLFKKNRNPDGKRNHPTQKPLALFKWCINFSKTANIILDPFLGSGTTAVAAKELGRKFIGIEISEEYCAIAVKRLRQGVLDFG
jgi:site-specific DNA-methyltransferase (adenine-specific)